MKRDLDEEQLDRLETLLGRLLHAGVLAAAVCLAAGLALGIAGALPSVSSVALTAGLMILMITPIMRVVVSFVEYARMGDWFFVATTVTVFLTLLLAWILKS